MENKTISVSCYAIWPEYSALDLYQNNETPHKVVESTRSVHDNILGRYTTCNTRLRYDQATHSVDYITLNSSRVRHKLGKINSETNHTNKLSGYPIEFGTHDYENTRAKLNKIRTACRKVLTKESDTVRNIAHLIGLMTHAKTAILLAPLFYRNLQYDLINVITASSYDHHVTIQKTCHTDLMWWINESSS